MPNGGRQQDIELSDGFFRGEDKAFEALVKQADDLTPQPMTGWDLEWTLSDREGGRVLVTVATVVISNGEATDDLASWSCLAASTLGLPAPAEYFHELWRVDSGVRRVLVYGAARLRRGRY